MGVKFLSDQWFEEVEAAKATIANFTVPAALSNISINITATEDDGEVLFCLSEGAFKKGHDDSASVNLILPHLLAYRIFIENDQSAGMQGFMSGDLRVEGDMSVIMALQNVEPSESHREYQAKVQALTEAS